MRALIGFFKKPLNQAGLVALGGVLLGWGSGQTNWQVTAITAAGAIVAWLMPDDSIAKEDVEKLVKDAINTATDIVERKGENS